MKKWYLFHRVPVNRSSKIWTCDFLVPNQELYQLSHTPKIRKTLLGLTLSFLLFTEPEGCHPKLACSSLSQKTLGRSPWLGILTILKDVRGGLFLPDCRRRTRTLDLKAMTLASFQLLHPAILILTLLLLEILSISHAAVRTRSWNFYPCGSFSIRAINTRRYFCFFKCVACWSIIK